MNLFRSIILFTLLGGLIIFLFQNLSPSLPLVFLGVKSKELPLSVWILFSLTAGIITSLVITTLLKFTVFSNSLSSANRVTSSRQTSRKDDRQPINVSHSLDAENDDFDDWEDSDDDEQWERESNTNYTGSTDKSASSSVYSYGSQSPENTAVGKREMIYDANYRVIIPPSTSEFDNINNQDEDDWSFLEDDFDDDFDVVDPERKKK